MKETKKLAAGAMMSALCVVIMLLGAVIDLGTYAAALLAGVAMIPYGQKYGCRYQLMVFTASAALSFMLVPNIEQNLMYMGFYGWYPILRQSLEKLKTPSKYIAKFFIFNVCFISIEALVMLVLLSSVPCSSSLFRTYKTAVQHTGALSSPHTVSNCVCIIDSCHDWIFLAAERTGFQLTHTRPSSAIHGWPHALPHPAGRHRSKRGRSPRRTGHCTPGT